MVLYECTSAVHKYGPQWSFSKKADGRPCPLKMHNANVSTAIVSSHTPLRQVLLHRKSCHASLKTQLCFCYHLTFGHLHQSYISWNARHSVRLHEIILLQEKATRLFAKLSDSLHCRASVGLLIAQMSLFVLILHWTAQGHYISVEYANLPRGGYSPKVTYTGLCFKPVRKNEETNNSGTNEPACGESGFIIKCTPRKAFPLLARQKNLSPCSLSELTSALLSYHGAMEVVWFIHHYPFSCYPSVCGLWFYFTI